MGRVESLWRYPVKSAGERVASVAVGPSGPDGDRAWAVVDEDGTVVSAKHPDRGGRLLAVAARHDDGDGTVWVQPPGAVAVRAGSAEADAALSDWLGRPVSLRSTAGPDVRLRRVWPTEAGLVPEWEPAAAPGEEAVTPMAGAARQHRFVDYGAVHLVTAGALRRLSAEHGRDVAAVRFRPNLVVGLDTDPEPGMLVEVGDAVLRVELPTPRCVIPGLAQPGADTDLPLLRTLARGHRRQVASLGRAACFGVYGQVQRPGRVWEGAPVRVVAG